MGVQITGGYYSDNGGNYDISIYNESFVGVSYEATVQSLKITWESQGDQIMEALKESRCSFTIVNDNAAVDTFITNLANGTEDQFKIVVEKQNDLYWCGVVLIDEVSFEDLPSKIRTFTITAVDGIGRLKNIPFDYTSSDTETMLKWIYECLEYNDLSQYWGASDAYFKESCEVYDTQMMNTGTQYSPLLQTRCSRFLFLSDEVQGERIVKRRYATITLPDYRPYTCAEVLNSILMLFSCRIMMSKGSYYIQQIRNFGGSTYNQRSISKALSVLSFQNVSPRKTEGTDWKRKRGGRFSYFAPLQQVRLDSVPVAAVAQSGGGVQTLDTATSPLVQTVQLGTLQGGTSSGKSFRIRLGIEFIKLTQFNQLVDIELNFTAGTTRLKSTLATPDIVQWTTTGTDRVYRQITPSTVYSSGSAINYIDIETPEFPLSSQASCSLSVTYTGTNFSGDAEAKIFPLQIMPLKDGAIIQEYQFSVESTNASPITKQSYVIDYGTPLLSDISQGITSNNTLEVNSTGSTWVFSGVWNAGFSSNVELIKTLCLETMSLQDLAVPVLQASLFVPDLYITGMTVPYAPRPDEVYYYDSQTWVFNGGTLDCRNDTLTGEWFQFIQGKSGLGVVEEKGDGQIYNKDIRIGTPKKNADDGDKYTRAYVTEGTQIGSISADTSAGAITSISVTTTTKAIKDGDQLAVVHPYNYRTVATVVVNGDQASGITSITINSTTPSELLYVGYLVLQRKDQIIESDKIRSNGLLLGDTIVTTSTSVPATGGFGSGAILNPDDGFLYYSDGSTTYKLTGTPVI